MRVHKPRTKPTRGVCFFRDRYYLHKELKECLNATSNYAYATNRFKSEIHKLIFKHKGHIEETTIRRPLEDGTMKIGTDTIVRFVDGSTATLPHPKSVFSEPEPFKYHARVGELIPEDWNADDYDVQEVVQA